MTENQTSYAPPSPPRPLLRRVPGERNVLGGVAAGVAEWLGIDPILVRVAFVVLTIFGGSGILLYIAGWIFIPEQGHADSAGERFFRNNSVLAIVAAVVLGVLVVGPMLAWGIWGDGPGFGGLVLLALVVAGVVALTRRNDQRAVAATLPPTPMSPMSDVDPQGQTSTAVLPSPYVAGPPPPSPTVVLPPPPPPPPPAPPKEKSVLGRLTFGVALLVAGTLLALNLADVTSFSGVTVLAATLGVVAIGLFVGTFLGRSRWLIALGVLLTVILIPAAAAPDGIEINGGTGDRVYRVQSAVELKDTYELGAGTLLLDLRRVEILTDTTVEASVGAGELTVILPPDVPVNATAEVGVGTVDFPGGPGEDGGVGLDRTWTRYPLARPPALDLDLSAGLGSITVIDDSQEVSR